LGCGSHGAGHDPGGFQLEPGDHRGGHGQNAEHLEKGRVPVEGPRKGWRLGLCGFLRRYGGTLVGRRRWSEGTALARGVILGTVGARFLCVPLSPSEAGPRSVRRDPAYRKADTPSRCTSARSQGPAAIERAACLGVFGARCKTCACTVLLALSASECGERLYVGVVLPYPLILLRIIPLLLPGSRAADGGCVTECEACTGPEGVRE